MDQYYDIIVITICTYLLQSAITYNCTNTKEFSYRALIRNLCICFSIYIAITTKKYYILLIPIIFEILIEYIKYKYMYIEKYIGVKYQYNDYWRNINKKDTIFSNFSEGNYDNLLGFSTTDLSQRNIKKILDWTQYIYNKSLTDKNELLTDLNNKKHNAIDLKKTSDDNKFKLICEKCKIVKGIKILEIGFGEGDFMNYIYKNYGIRPVGVSIAKEQVKLVKNRGFLAYEMNSWNMLPEELGKYDLIIQCGNLEYIKYTLDSPDIYTDYANIIQSLLNDGGKFFITCIHLNDKFTYSLYDDIRMYILWSGMGGDGSYPKSKDGLLKYFEKAGLKKIYQEDRTIDYWVTTVIFMSYFQCRKNNECVNSLSISGLFDALLKTIAAPYYLHTYLLYSPTADYFWLPWLWEFVPQIRNNKLEFPTSLEYILFQK